ncbi:PTS sugar transporter subunit IIA [Listeria ilorinensis]|uniref:PTS sugar transporter subunit IIA n=1 Tax=Listeria ilorinensis TaxID=2867439 RepID=UPI001EF519C7|nr:PTS sugar transporter subunit IIA [Listeria ilorinensis]
MKIKKFMDEQLVLFTAKTEKETVLAELSDLLYQTEKVKDSYKEAVIERERVFPTGLETEYIRVAIPHTDSIHVRKPAIAVGILEKPIDFVLMGTSDEQIAVEVIFMLAIEKAEEQLELLQALIQLIQEKDFARSIKKCLNGQEVLQVIEKISERANV